MKCSLIMNQCDESLFLSSFFSIFFTFFLTLLHYFFLSCTLSLCHIRIPFASISDLSTDKQCDNKKKKHSRQTEMKTTIGTVCAITYRTSSVCKTSGSCRYDKAVRSFCPIKMAGFRSNGKSCSFRISMTRSWPVSVMMCNCLSPSWKLSRNSAPSHTVIAFGIQTRAPCNRYEKLESNTHQKITK